MKDKFLMIYRAVKGKALYYIILLIGFVTVIFLAILKDVIDEDFWGISAGLSLTGAVAILLRIISYILEYKFEDRIKLTNKFDYLLNQYSEEKFIKISQDGNDVVFPITLVEKLDPETTIELIYEKREYSLPYASKGNFNRLLEAHKHSKIENNWKYRLYSYEYEDKKLKLYLQKTTYINSLVTNRSCDFRLENDVTLRNIFEFGTKLQSFNETQLSNHLGTYGFVQTNDEFIVIKRMNKDDSIAKKLYSNTIGIGLDVDQDENGVINQNTIKKQIAKNIEKLLCLPNKLGDDDIELTPLSLERTTIECGKPGIDFIIKLKNFSSKELKNHFSKIMESKKDYIRKERKRIKKMIVVKPSDVKINECDFFTIYGKKYRTSPVCSAVFCMTFMNDKITTYSKINDNTTDEERKKINKANKKRIKKTNKQERKKFKKEKTKERKTA